MRRAVSTPRPGLVLALAALLTVIAVREIQARRRPDGVAQLLRTAATADAAEREKALATLVAGGDDAAWKLFAHLDKGSARERDMAAEALGRIGGRTVGRSAEQRYRRLQARPSPSNAEARRRLLIVYTRTNGEAAVKLTVAALHDPLLRETAEAELRRLGPPAARALVITASHQDTSVQEAAIRVLATMPEAAAPMIVPMFQRPSDKASQFAGMLLAELRDPKVVPELVRLVRERDAHDESDVLRALALYEDHPLARDAIAEALGSPFPYLRFAALEVIRGWRDEEGVARVKGPLLAIVRDDDSWEVQEGGIRSALALWLKEAAPLLVALVRNDEVYPAAREAAAEALGFLGPGDVTVPLVRILEAKPDAEFTEPLRRALRRLTYRPEDAPWEEFRTPAPAVAAVGEPRPLVALTDLPDDALPAWRVGEKGPAVVVVGGLPTFAHEQLAPWLGPLADEYRFFAVDLPPLPDDPQAAGGWEQTFDRGLATLMQHLELEQASLLGHGLGALLALRFAMRHPGDVERLALVGMPAPHKAAWTGWTTATMRRLPPDALHDLEVLRTGWKGKLPVSAERGLWRVLAGALFHEPPNAVLVREGEGPRQLGRPLLDALGPFDLRPDLQGLSVPVLFIVGASDPLPDEQRAYFRARHEETGGRQRFVEIPDAGHFPFLERPAAFREELRRWFPRATEEGR